MGFIFYHMLTFICYIQVNFTLALVDCARYYKDFVNLRFVKSRDKIALGNCLISHTKKPHHKHGSDRDRIRQAAGPYELRTEFTNLIAKSTSPGLSDTTLFALCNLPQWYQFVIYFLGNAFWLFFVSLLWGSTNPLIRKGSKGIEEIHRSSHIQQFFAEVIFLASNWKVLWIFVQEYVLLFVLAWPSSPYMVRNKPVNSLLENLIQFTRICWFNKPLWSLIIIKNWYSNSIIEHWAH